MTLTMTVERPEDDIALESELAALVAQYELAQRNRIASGAFLRAHGAGSNAFPDIAPTGRAASRALLREIDEQDGKGSGGSGGSGLLLGMLYREESRMEQLLADAMTACVQRHRTWPWLLRVKGIGPVLSARLLARLRIDRAPTPSSFWKYCGLATEEGERYTCAGCGATMTLSAGRSPRGPHRSPDGHRCNASFQVDRSCAARTAMRHPLRGQRRSFDVDARTICHLVGVSFLRRGGAYRHVYDELRARIPTEHPDWTALHQHRAAMRVMEKLFLAHLWAVWREQLGDTPRPAYEVARRGRAAVARKPWSMVDS
jgi:hypothetical protein